MTDMVVYVIGPSDGPQKIGISKEVTRRLEYLQSGNGFTLEVAASFRLRSDKARLVEKRAHSLLGDKRLRGEWFDVSPNVAVKAVKDAIEWLDTPKDQREQKEPPLVMEKPSLPETWMVLKEARRAANLSQSEVAASLGIGQGSLSDFERGRRPFPRGLYSRLPAAIRARVIDAAKAELDSLL